MKKKISLFLALLVAGHLSAQTGYNVSPDYASFDPTVHDGADIEALVSGQIGPNVSTNCHGYAFACAVGQPLPNGIGTEINAPELDVMLINNQIDHCPQSQATHVIWYFVPPAGTPWSFDDAHLIWHSAVASQFQSFPFSDGWVQSRNGLLPSTVLHKISAYNPPAGVQPFYFKTNWNLIPTDGEPPTPSAVFSCGAYMDEANSCYQGTTGVAEVVHSITGINSTFSYDWSNGASTFFADGLAAGTYTVTVTESPTNYFCISSAQVTEPATEFSHFNYVAHDPADLCVGYSGTGRARVKVVSGAKLADYSIAWDANTGNQTGKLAIDLCYGQYDMTMTHNQSGCVQTHTADVPIGFSFKRDVADVAENEIDRFQLYPNPMSEVLQVEVSGDQPLRVKLLTLEGRLVLDQTVQPGIRTIEVDQLAAGTYLVRIEDGDRVETQKVVKY